MTVKALKIAALWQAEPERLIRMRPVFGAVSKCPESPGKRAGCQSALSAVGWSTLPQYIQSLCLALYRNKGHDVDFMQINKVLVDFVCGK